MIGRNSLFGPLDPAPDAGYDDPPPRKGFFTDTSVCIGCKACEVACKEWNLIPDDGFNLLGQSYDNTGGLTANSWRHVAFVEQPTHPVDVLAAAGTSPDTGTDPGVPPAPQFLGMPWHWGWQGLAVGDVVNDLTSWVGDPNVSIHEGKAFVCNVEKE